jgi:hypothetical protein
MVEPGRFISTRNGFAMRFRNFISHLMNVLDHQFGMSVHGRTAFIKFVALHWFTYTSFDVFYFPSNNMHDFAAHRNIAYRFLSPTRVAAAVDIEVGAKTCTFTRLFLVFRGLTDEEMTMFGGSGIEEANAYNWREVVGWSEHSKDPEMFRILETSVLEVK